MTSPSRPLPSFHATAIVIAVALLLAVGLGIVAAGDRLVPGDVRIAQAVQRLDGNFTANLAKIGNLLGSTGWTVVALVLALTGAALLKARPEMIYVATLMVLRLAGTQLKGSFDSPRPTDNLVLITGIHDGTGYPSGHSLTAATLALGLAVLAWRHIPSRRLAIGAVIALLGMMILTGWARIWTGAHWPSDVIGGYAFGIVTAGIGVIVLNRQSPNRCACANCVGLDADNGVGNEPSQESKHRDEAGEKINRAV